MKLSSARCAPLPGGTTHKIVTRARWGLTLEQQQTLCIARLLPLKPQVICEEIFYLVAGRRCGHQASGGVNT